jgi:protein-S-isoprenylcysteine O-methyltransferase Ste14
MIAGLVLLSLSLVLMTSAFIVMGSQLTWTPQTIQGQKLVVSGPYAIIRHPLLVSFLLANLGAMMYGGAWFPFAMYLPLFGHSLVLLPKEEQFLAEEFGKDYEIYRTKTGKLWPNLFSLVSKNRKQSIINQQYENVSNEESFSRPKNATYGSAVI